MDIEYKRLTENELSRIIKMRIEQLTEEYRSDGRTVPEDVDLETALMDFYTRNMAAGTYVSWLAFDGDKIVGTRPMLEQGSSPSRRTWRRCSLRS